MSAKPTYSLDQVAYQLTHGFSKYFGSGIGGFDVKPGGTLNYHVSKIDGNGAWFAEKALAAWSAATGIKFKKVTNAGSADITFADGDQSGAYADSSYSGNHITHSTVNIPAWWYSGDEGKLNSYSYQTYLHEIGHALGLGHAGNYNGNANYNSDAIYSNDSWQTTVMSYFSQTEAGSGASKAFVLTPMAADLVAIHNLYGTPTNVNKGDTVYGYGSNASGVAKDFVKYASNAMTMTIYDSKGYDTLDFSSYSGGQKINLNSKSFSNVLGKTGNLIIGKDVVVEAAKGGSGKDTLIGNSASNYLKGGSGNDKLSGASGNDKLKGDNGNDKLYGGNGNDKLYGGKGKDKLYGDKGADKIYGGKGNDKLGGGHGSDLLKAGDGNDKLYGGNQNDKLYGEKGKDLLKGGNGHDKVSGDKGNDKLYGGNGNDRLYGGNNNDKLYGEKGNDLLQGGKGNDFLKGGKGADDFYFNSGKDKIADFNQKAGDDLYLEDGLWSGKLTAKQVVSKFATVQDGDTVFDFGNGNTLTVEGIGNAQSLVDDLIFY